MLLAKWIIKDVVGDDPLKRLVWHHISLATMNNIWKSVGWFNKILMSSYHLSLLSLCKAK